MPSDHTLVALAVLTAPHGVRGELRAKLYNLDSDLLLQMETLSLRTPDGDVSQVRIESARPHKQGLLIILDAVRDRNGAEAVRGHELCVERSNLPDDLEPGEWYVVDLVGLSARRPDGSAVGPVMEVLDYPTSQVLVVETPEGDLEIPVREPYLVDVDVAGGQLTVDGLDDLEPVKRRRNRG